MAENVSLEFLAELMQRMLQRQDDMDRRLTKLEAKVESMQDDMLVLLGIAQRTDGNMQGLVNEMRGLQRQ